MRFSHLLSILLVLIALLATGCPKKIPQPEIDRAKSAMANIENYKDCAPESYQAAKTMMDRAQALLKEKRYEEAKTALIAAEKLAMKAAEECKRKRQEEEEAKRKQAELDAQNASREIENTPAELGTPVAEMNTITFGFNTSDLTDESQKTLANNAEYIRANAGLRVQIEGHCDSRGSTEYNLSLGERRALEVKKYLTKLGINPDRLEIISYGAERPVDPAQGEEAWAKNRRAEFLKLQ